VRELACSCCGGYTRGRQWWNRDKGYGLCIACVAFATKGMSDADIRKTYGERGIHYAV
jgi:hypothetical protein